MSFFNRFPVDYFSVGPRLPPDQEEPAASPGRDRGRQEERALHTTGDADGGAQDIHVMKHDFPD